MKATGIVRRIDDLGRVVIPKEIRRSLRIREGEALEIFTDNINGMPCVCFAKYQTSFSSDLKAVGEKIHDEMTNCAEWEIASEFRKAMEEAAKILKKFKERD